MYPMYGAIAALVEKGENNGTPGTVAPTVVGHIIL